MSLSHHDLMSPSNSLILLVTTIWPIHVFSSASLAFFSANILRPHFWRSCNPGLTLQTNVTDGSMTSLLHPLLLLSQWTPVTNHPAHVVTLHRMRAQDPLISLLHSQHTQLSQCEHPHGAMISATHDCSGSRPLSSTFLKIPFLVPGQVKNKHSQNSAPYGWPLSISTSTVQLLSPMLQIFQLYFCMCIFIFLCLYVPKQCSYNV